MATITVDRPNQVANPPVAQSDNTQTAAERQRELLDGFHRKHLNVRNLDWPVLLWMVGIHVGAVAALFFFTWQAVVAAVVMHWLTCSIGICLGYHRLLTHQSFKTYRPVLGRGVALELGCQSPGPPSTLRPGRRSSLTDRWQLVVSHDVGVRQKVAGRASSSV